MTIAYTEASSRGIKASPDASVLELSTEKSHHGEVLPSCAITHLIMAVPLKIHVYTYIAYYKYCI